MVFYEENGFLNILAVFQPAQQQDGKNGKKNSKTHFYKTSNDVLAYAGPLGTNHYNVIFCDVALTLLLMLFKPEEQNRFIKKVGSLFNLQIIHI